MNIPIIKLDIYNIWWFEHSVSQFRVCLSAEGAKNVSRNDQRDCTCDLLQILYCGCDLFNCRAIKLVTYTVCISMYLRVAFDSFLVRFHSFLVKVYLPVCKIFLHFKSIFENIYLQLRLILSFRRQQNNRNLHILGKITKF